jgi:hypothetical protein
MTNLELAKRIRHGLFTDRETVDEAWKNMFDSINQLPEAERLGITVPVMILMNTISKQIEANEKQRAADSWNGSVDRQGGSFDQSEYDRETW